MSGPAYIRPEHGCLLPGERAVSGERGVPRFSKKRARAVAAAVSGPLQHV
jgi:hypothetical protein